MFLLHTRRQSSKGFFSVEIILYACIACATTLIFSTLFTNSVKRYKEAYSRECLLRQAVICEETVRHELRYAENVRVSGKTVTYTDENGKNAGFTVHKFGLYKKLNNGTVQPLTGDDDGAEQHTAVFVEAYGREAFFQKDEEAIVMHFMLKDRVTEEEQECCVYVVPLATAWKDEYGKNS